MIKGNSMEAQDVCVQSESGIRTYQKQMLEQSSVSGFLKIKAVLYQPGLIFNLD